jgi:hypothetical protein
MTTRKVFHCIVDDTALITNISEIKNWVFRGVITLVVPVYSECISSRRGDFHANHDIALERLQILRQDGSQIGMNAREAQKFLDQVTSGKDGFSEKSVTIQEPDEQYKKWAGVEAHFILDTPKEQDENATPTEEDMKGKTLVAEEPERPQSSGGSNAQMLLNKLNFAKALEQSSPNSTPPTSPTSSGRPSSKTSPVVMNSSMITDDVSATPQMLKPLINSVVWYTYEKKSNVENPDFLFLTNAAETAALARGFGVMPKNIHQLRTSIGMEDQEVKNHEKFSKKHLTPPATAIADNEPKGLLKYDEDSDDDDVVVFKARGRGTRGTTSNRGSPVGTLRGKPGMQRSPAASMSIPNGQVKPQVPLEEIDPDSFDRGSFARGSVPLANTGNNHYHNNHHPSNFHGFPRGLGPRGGFSPAGPSRGGFSRGAPRGGFADRGSVRGRGRLFVP